MVPSVFHVSVSEYILCDIIEPLSAVHRLSTFTRINLFTNLSWKLQD